LIASTTEWAGVTERKHGSSGAGDGFAGHVHPDDDDSHHHIQQHRPGQGGPGKLRVTDRRVAPQLLLADRHQQGRPRPIGHGNTGHQPAHRGRDRRRHRGERDRPLMTHPGPDRADMPAAVPAGNGGRVDMRDPEHHTADEQQHGQGRRRAKVAGADDHRRGEHRAVHRRGVIARTNRFRCSGPDPADSGSAAPGSRSIGLIAASWRAPEDGSTARPGTVHPALIIGGPCGLYLPRSAGRQRRRGIHPHYPLP